MDEVTLRVTVAELLEEAWRRPVNVISLQRRPSPFATLFPAEVLSISLEGGDRFSLFLKHLGSEQADHPDKQCRDREIRIYEELLRDKDLPVVRYYGWRWDETTKRRELFLEYIDDYKLEWHELEHWFTAAHRLAYLHAHFAQRVEKLLACDFLLRFDSTYFMEWANRALCTVGNQSVELATKLEPIVQRCSRIADLLSGQSLTLVHNDLAPKNALANTSHSPARICFVDWEMAGVGCGLLDLVHLNYGFKAAEDRKMRSIYCAELAGTGLLPSSARDLKSLFAACALHKGLYRLAGSQSRGVGVKRVARWVSEVQHHFAQT